MGIKDYLKYLNHEEPDKKSRNYEHIYIDCNYMVHYLIYKCQNDAQFYSRIYDYFGYIFETLKVSKTINLVYDGHYDKKMPSNPKQQTHILRNKYKKESDDYDKQSIYPGSQILTTFKTYIVDIIDKYKKIHMLNFQINISDDTIEGEADLKILDKINQSDHNKICILSKDSDMILISYSLIIKKNILIDVMTSLRPIKFVDVNKIVNLSKPIFNGDKFVKSFGPDYILIIILLGNDYIPKISNINYETLISCYQKYISHGNKSIINKNKVKKSNLINYISYIIINKKVKFNKKNLDLERFSIYFNNLCWTLKYYGLIENELEYIQDSPLDENIDINNLENELELMEKNIESNTNNIINTETTENQIKDSKIRLKNVINIYNFINGLV